MVGSDPMDPLINTLLFGSTEGVLTPQLPLDRTLLQKYFEKTYLKYSSIINHTNWKWAKSALVRRIFFVFHLVVIGLLKDTVGSGTLNSSSNETLKLALSFGFKYFFFSSFHRISIMNKIC